MYRRRCGPGCRGSALAAGCARVLVAGVVLHVAQGGAGVQGEGDRRMAQAVRRELLPPADPVGAGQTAHQLPQVALAQPPAGGGGQQRPGQLPPLPRPGPLRPVGQVGLQGRHRGRGERDLRLPRALADHAQHPVAAMLAEVGDVSSAGLIDAQDVVQQQPHHRRGARRLGAGASRPSAGLVAVQLPCSPDLPRAGPGPGWAPGRSGHGRRSTGRTTTAGTSFSLDTPGRLTGLGRVSASPRLNQEPYRPGLPFPEGSSSRPALDFVGADASGVVVSGTGTRPASISNWLRSAG